MPTNWSALTRTTTWANSLGLLFHEQVEPKPHQIDAALFALQPPFQRGVILADEVGLGKTIEVGIVMSQCWAERKRRILIIAPASLRQKWKQELWEKFMLPAELLDRKSLPNLLNAQSESRPSVLICSYEFARTNQLSLDQDDLYRGENLGFDKACRRCLIPC